VRLRLSRQKGFDLQKLSLAVNGRPAVNVARPSRWGNSFRIAEWGREDAVAHFAKNLKDAGASHVDFSFLRGKNLACWCAVGGPCHADVLLELANA
jgi:hypothetical protein